MRVQKWNQLRRRNLSDDGEHGKHLHNFLRPSRPMPRYPQLPVLYTFLSVIGTASARVVLRRRVSALVVMCSPRAVVWADLRVRPSRVASLREHTHRRVVAPRRRSVSALTATFVPCAARVVSGGSWARWRRPGRDRARFARASITRRDLPPSARASTRARLRIVHALRPFES